MEMNDFVENILQNKFYGCCCILLLGIDKHLPAALRCYFRCNWCRNLAAAKPEPSCIRQGHSRRMGADVGNVSIRCLVVLANHAAFHRWSSQTVELLLPTDIWTDELLRGEYKRMSRFEMPCIPTRWTGEHWVEPMSRLHGAGCCRQCGCFAAKLNRLDTREDREIVPLVQDARIQSQVASIVDAKVNEAGVTDGSLQKETLSYKHSNTGFEYLRNFALVTLPQKWPQSKRTVKPTTYMELVLFLGEKLMLTNNYPNSMERSSWQRAFQQVHHDAPHSNSNFILRRQNRQWIRFVAQVWLVDMHMRCQVLYWQFFLENHVFYIFHLLILKQNI